MKEYLKEGKMKNYFLVLTVFLTLALLLGTFYTVGAQEELADDQNFQFGINVRDTQTFEPTNISATADKFIADLIFNALVRYPPGDQVYAEGDLAKSWEVSKDGKEWTFYLREGVFFHPFPGYPSGYELTSEDVVYSLKRSSDPDFSAYSGEYEGMNFEAVDKYTVKITVKEPLSEILFFPKIADYGSGFIVCKKAREELGDEWAKSNPIGTGPFMFASYEPTQKVVLVKNENYYRGEPILESVTVRYMPEVSPRELGFRSGELHMITGLNQKEWLDKINTFPDTVINFFGPGDTQMIHFNMSMAPFDNINVRRAFCYAVSREAMAFLMGGEEYGASPIYSSALAPPAPGALTKEEVIEAGLFVEQDIELAKQLLSDAGYPDGLKVEIISSEHEQYLKGYVAIQSMLREIGIDMSIKVVDHASFHSLIRQNASPFVNYLCWRPNVGNFLRRFYHSNSAVTIGKNPDTNFSLYGTVDANGDGKIDSIDELIEKAQLELDSEKQIELWKEAQIKLLEDVAVFPVIRMLTPTPMKSYVDLGYTGTYNWTVAGPPQITEKTRILAH
jgi:peptide/nickel transport system substrate-binding protein